MFFTSPSRRLHFHNYPDASTRICLTKACALKRKFPSSHDIARKISINIEETTSRESQKAWIYNGGSCLATCPDGWSVSHVEVVNFALRTQMRLPGPCALTECSYPISVTCMCTGNMTCWVGVRTFACAPGLCSIHRPLAVHQTLAGPLQLSAQVFRHDDVPTLRIRVPSAFTRERRCVHTLDFSAAQRSFPCFHVDLPRTCCTHIARCRLGQLLYHRTFAVFCVDLGTPMMYARRQIS